MIYVLIAPKTDFLQWVDRGGNRLAGVAVRRVRQLSRLLAAPKRPVGSSSDQNSLPNSTCRRVLGTSRCWVTPPSCSNQPKIGAFQSGINGASNFCAPSTDLFWAV